MQLPPSRPSSSFSTSEMFNFRLFNATNAEWGVFLFRMAPTGGISASLQFSSITNKAMTDKADLVSYFFKAIHSSKIALIYEKLIFEYSKDFWVKKWTDDYQPLKWTEFKLLWTGLLSQEKCPSVKLRGFKCLMWLHCRNRVAFNSFEYKKFPSLHVEERKEVLKRLLLSIK